MVLLGHFVMSYKVFPGISYPLAGLGVEFFFVISGFLITTLLLKEKVRMGTISLKDFYIRRFFRIIPVAYLYLTSVVAANLIFKLHVAYFSLIVSFLFVRNFFMYSNGVNNLATHYWSLSVEEQFYLVFPVILKKWWRCYVAFLLGIMATSVLSDFWVLVVEPAAQPSNFMLVLMRQFQSIAIGSLCAIFLFQNPGIPGPKLVRKSLISAVLFVIIVSFAFLRTLVPFTVSLLQSILFAAILVVNLQGGESASFRLLNNKWMRLIGALSYSIYIWQQPFTLNLTFIDALSVMKPYKDDLLFHLCVTLISLVLLVLISCLSYFYYEKPFLMLKKRFGPKGLSLG